MLINGLLFNSEAWHSVGKEDIKHLEKVDELILRSLMQSHPKTPLEFLYLETGSLPINYILSIRRMMYLKTLMMRDEEELTKRILRELEKNSCPGDFIELIKEDFQKIGKEYTEGFVTNTGQIEYKQTIKNLTRKKAFKDLVNVQLSHSKVMDIKYDSFKCQSYLSSGIFSNEEVSILASLRSHTLRSVRCNFKKFYQGNYSCPLKCWPVGSPSLEHTQEHWLL